MNDYGRNSLKGYKAQTMVALLNALQFEKNDWQSFSIEPRDEKKEVDIFFKLQDGSILLIQVKSSKNEFSETSANSILRTLKDAYKEKEETYQFKLILVGEFKGDTSKEEIEVVPFIIDNILSEISRCLKHFFASQSVSEPSDEGLMTLVNALCNIAEMDLIAYKEYRKEDFIKVLKDLNETVLQIDRLSTDQIKLLRSVCNNLIVMLDQINSKNSEGQLTIIDLNPNAYLDLPSEIESLSSSLSNNGVLANRVDKIKQASKNLFTQSKFHSDKVRIIYERKHPKDKEIEVMQKAQSAFENSKVGYLEDISVIKDFLLFVGSKFERSYRQ